MPQRRAARPDLRAAGALLPPRLLAAAADQRPVLGRVRPLPFGGVRPHDRLPDQLGVDPSAEDLVAHIERADLLVVVVHDV
jgi:hypothetical protein